MPIDLYQQSGEFIDILSQDAWQILRAPLTAALHGARPAQGPIVDIGAGTGLGTVVAAAAVPEGEIIAVEPSPILRAVLLSRVVSTEQLRRRVTVQAADVDGMRLPPSLGGALAMNMVGHLAPPQRRRLWTDLRIRLTPSAPLVVNLQPPAEPMTIPETEFTSVSIGTRVYQGSGAARPAGGDTVVWTMRYRTLLPDGSVDTELVVDSPWHVVSPAQLLDELTEAGFSATAGQGDLVVATPADET